MSAQTERLMHFMPALRRSNHFAGLEPDSQSEHGFLAYRRKGPARIVLETTPERDNTRIGSVSVSEFVQLLGFRLVASAIKPDAEEEALDRAFTRVFGILAIAICIGGYVWT